MRASEVSEKAQLNFFLIFNYKINNMIEESPRFDLDAGLAQMAPDEIHNLLPLRDLDFFKDEFKHSPVNLLTLSDPPICCQLVSGA